MCGQVEIPPSSSSSSWSRKCWRVMIKKARGISPSSPRQPWRWPCFPRLRPRGEKSHTSHTGTQTQTQTQTQTHRHTGTQAHTETHTERHRETHTIKSALSTHFERICISKGEAHCRVEHQGFRTLSSEFSLSLPFLLLLLPLFPMGALFPS